MYFEKNYDSRERLGGVLGLPDGENAGGKDVICAAHAFLARTSAAVAMAQLDDITLETEPVNVPGTSDEYPNWRRRYATDLEELAADSLLRPIADTMNAGGPK